MKMQQMFLALALAAFVVPSLAEAQSLGEKKKRKEQEEYLQKEVEYTQQQCGAKFPVSFDWAKFVLDDMQTYSAYGYCDSVLGALETVCGDADGKEAVQQKVKKVVCKFGGKDKRAINLGKDGTLEWTIDWDAANNEDYIKEYLMKAL